MSPSKINLVDDANGSPSQTDKGFIDLASGTVAKPSTQAAEEEARAQAEAAEQKLKFEQQDKISGGKHDDVHSESAQNSEDQNDSRNHTNKHGMLSNEIPSSRESESAHGAIQNQMTEKVLFELTWGSKGKDIVSFEKGNIKTAGHTSEQITLTWKSEPQTVLIITKPNSDTVPDLCEDIVSWLYMRKKKIYVQPSVRGELLGISSSFKFVKTWQDEREIPDLHKKVDLVITLGGDGTVLWGSQGVITSLKLETMNIHLLGSIIVPRTGAPCCLLQFRVLGLYDPFQQGWLQKQLELILKGPIRITLRRRLQCQIVRDLAAEDENAMAKKIFVLNEVTIDRGQSPYLTNLKCYCDDKYVTLVQGDGLILSTTSGSTAYSLAAGGSMVHPQVPGIVLTPICPHSLSFRPLILPDHVVIGVKVSDGAQRSSPLSPSPSPRTPSRHSSASVSFDGKGRQELTAGNKLKCSMAPWPVPTVCLNDSTRDFLCSILEGLHWNQRKTQSSDGPTQ